MLLPGSQCATKTVDNIEHVEALVHSQDDQPQTHPTMHETIARKTGINY